jgi:hypothetical protein
VIEPSSGRIDQADGEALDDKEVITRPAHGAVVLQPDVGISLAVILDAFVGCTKMPREARIAHVAPECFRSRPLMAHS